MDISRCVTAVRIDLTCGALSRASIDIITADVEAEALILDDATLGAFAETLRAHGWTVEPKAKP